MFYLGLMADNQVKADACWTLLAPTVGPSLSPAVICRKHKGMAIGFWSPPYGGLRQGKGLEIALIAFRPDPNRAMASLFFSSSPYGR